MKKNLYILVIIVLLVACVLCNCTSGSEAPTGSPTATEEIAASDLPIDPYKSGYKHLYKVGEDIEAGLYLATATDGKIAGFCIASDPECDDILSNGHFEGRSYIEVKDGEYLDTSLCDILPFSQAEPYRPANGIIADGQYLVGFDIEPGTYRLVGTGSNGAGHYTITTDANGDNLVDKDTFFDSAYVRLINTEYIQLEYCVLEVE